MKRLLVLIAVSSLAACAQGGGTPGGTAAGTMAASPANITLNSGLAYFPTPQPVTVTSSAGFNGVSFVNPDPAGLSVSVSSVSANTATLALTQIGPMGAEPLVVKNNLGEQTTVHIQGTVCGRPPYLDWAALTYPAPGSRNVPVTLSTVYLQIGVPAQLGFNGSGVPNAKLHLVINANATADPPGYLQAATPPPNAATPTPPPNTLTFNAAGSIPALSSGAQYEVYAYEDACGGEVLDAGGFST
jgi:hypothetical protein